MDTLELIVIRDMAVERENDSLLAKVRRVITLRIEMKVLQAYYSMAKTPAIPVENRM